MRLMMKSKRLSNMELLRIFSMLFIIISHLNIYGINWGGKSVPIEDNLCLYNIGGFIEPFCVIGVNLFFLLSGYFSIKHSWKKWINIIITVYIYMIIIQGIGLCTGFNHFDKELLKLVLLPFNKYWFLKVYLFMMLMSPFLNIIVESVSKKKSLVRYFLIVFMMAFCAYGFFDADPHLGIARGYSLLSACCLYIIGGFIKNGVIFTQPYKPRIWFGLYAASAAVNAVMTLIVINCFGIRQLAVVLQTYCSPIIIMASLFLFVGFTRLKFDEDGKISNVIRFFSSNVLAVYIIHSSNVVVPHYRNLVVQNVLARSNVIAAYAFIIPYAIAIFVACVLIDKLFQISIGRIVSSISNFIGEKLNQLQEKITK